MLYQLSNCNGSFHYHLPSKYNLFYNNHYYMHQKNDGDCILLLHQSSGAWKIFPCAPFLSQVTFLTIRSIHLKYSVEYLHLISVFSDILFWIIFLPFNNKVVPKPRGSSTDLNLDNIFCLKCILNACVSSSTFHKTSSVSSFGKFPNRSLFLVTQVFVFVLDIFLGLNVEVSYSCW